MASGRISPSGLQFLALEHGPEGSVVPSRGGIEGPWSSSLVEAIPPSVNNSRPSVSGLGPRGEAWRVRVLSYTAASARYPVSMCRAGLGSTFRSVTGLFPPDGGLGPHVSVGPHRRLRGNKNKNERSTTSGHDQTRRGQFSGIAVLGNPCAAAMPTRSVRIVAGKGRTPRIDTFHP
jgi:hypothetical protein